MGGQPCYLKQIMNGARIVNGVNNITGQIQRIRDGKDPDIPEDVGYKIVELFNQMEDLGCQAERILLEGSGFTGPWPHSLS